MATTLLTEAAAAIMAADTTGLPPGRTKMAAAVGTSLGAAVVGGVTTEEGTYG